MRCPVCRVEARERVFPLSEILLSVADGCVGVDQDIPGLMDGRVCWIGWLRLGTIPQMEIENIHDDYLPNTRSRQLLRCEIIPN